MKNIILVLLLLFSSIYAENIKLSYRNGVYHIPVTLNDSVRLEFVVDTGAATLLLPYDVFSTLVRTGTISETDILGKAQSVTATGEVIEIGRVNIRQLQIGNQIIHNIEAGIGGENASLLLGQSALKKLEPWSINTQQKILIIKPLDSNAIDNSTSTDTVSVQQIYAFIDEYISRGNSKDIDGVLDLYGDEVDYFNAGIVSKNRIYKDKVDYYKRWPSVQCSLVKVDAIQDVNSLKNAKKVTYRINFDVYNYDESKGIKGQASNTVILKKEKGVIKIVSDKQKVLHREKY